MKKQRMVSLEAIKEVSDYVEVCKQIIERAQALRQQLFDEDPEAQISSAFDIVDLSAIAYVTFKGQNFTDNGGGHDIPTIARLQAENEAIENAGIKLE